MAQRLTFTTMGKQTVAELLSDIVETELTNLSLSASDAERTAFVVSALMTRGSFENFDDHGEWKKPETHS